MWVLLSYSRTIADDTETMRSRDIRLKTYPSLERHLFNAAEQKIMKEDTLLATPLSLSDMEVDLDLQVSEEEEKDLLDPEGVDEVKENHPPSAEVEVAFTPELSMLSLEQEASDREVGEATALSGPSPL